MHEALEIPHCPTDQISAFLDTLRTAARAGGLLVLPPEHVGILLSSDVYALLSRMEAQTFRTTRRKGIGQVSRVPELPANPPDSAPEERATVFRERVQVPASEPVDTPCVELLIAEWLKFHVSRLAAPDRYRYSADHLRTFFNDERRVGQLGERVLVKDLTPDLQARFREWRSASGVGGHTVSRDLAALRGALTWAWKHQRIPKPPPFIADVPFHLRGRPRDRVLSMQEVAAIIAACAGRPDREHVIRFIVIELGTAGRPQAVLELEHSNIDLERNLIDPNHPGRTHARKRRAIVPMAKAVRPWVVGIEGKLIKYRVQLAAGEPGRAPEYFERETKSIKTSWNKACADAGVAGATPKTLRHTMLTWLAERGVPYEQRQVLAGHSARGTTARHYEHLSPSYLKAAIKEVDAYFVGLRKLTSAVDGPAVHPMKNIKAA
jgi:integrase